MMERVVFTVLLIEKRMILASLVRENRCFSCSSNVALLGEMLRTSQCMRKQMLKTEGSHKDGVHLQNGCKKQEQQAELAETVVAGAPAFFAIR